MLIPLIVACALFMENLEFDGPSHLAAGHRRTTSAKARSGSSSRITSYLFSLAVFIPISGWVADRYGAEKVFRGAIVVFLPARSCAGSATRCGRWWPRACCRGWAAP